MRNPGKFTLDDLMKFLQGKETTTLKLTGRDGAGKVTFLAVLAVDGAAADLEEVVSQFEESQG